MTRFSTGQRVSPIFHLTHLYGPVKDTDLQNQLGGTRDGVFCEYAVFNEHSCVELPSTLSYREAATLPCAALTAWNAIYGGPKQLKPGDVVLTQGSGGVSIFALQFAKLGGAQVISTTSSLEKGTKLQELGADVIINYAEDSNWVRQLNSNRTEREELILWSRLPIRWLNLPRPLPTMDALQLLEEEETLKEEPASLTARC